MPSRGMVLTVPYASPVKKVLSKYGLKLKPPVLFGSNLRKAKGTRPLDRSRIALGGACLFSELMECLDDCNQRKRRRGDGGGERHRPGAGDRACRARLRS